MTALHCSPQGHTGSRGVRNVSLLSGAKGERDKAEITLSEMVKCTKQTCIGLQGHWSMGGAKCVAKSHCTCE